MVKRIGLGVAFLVGVQAAPAPGVPPSKPATVPAATRPAGLKLKADAPAKVREYVRTAQAMRPATIDLARADVAKARERLGMARRGGNREAVAQADAMVKAATNRLAAVSAPDFLPSPTVHPLEVGAIGTPPVETLHIVQVIDKTNVIVSFPIPQPAGQPDPRGGRRDFEQALVWIEGIDTAGMVDGQGIAAVPVEVVGTKQYQTAAGARTVFKLRPFDLKAYLE